MKKYPVVEMFDSIQGEGAMIGMPVTFIRFAGCNLACPWCDSKETWKTPDPDEDATEEHPGYTWLSVEEICARCTKSIVVFTGGEPLLQQLEPLILALQCAAKFVCVETNGTLPTPEGLDWVVCSPKPPEYFIHGECFFSELKYVADDNLTMDCISKEALTLPGGVWIQPCDFGTDEEATKASYQRVVDMVLNNPTLRAGIQLHKVLNVK